jgi:catechol 2,3-dioxygenase-like lactoylglutathione lyase family enzyme
LRERKTENGQPKTKTKDQRPLSIDHVQITIPIGQEQLARAFYCGVLGLSEIEKPESLRERGGLWLEVGGQQLHIGVEDGIDRTSSKAHVAYRIIDISRWRAKLEEAGCFILESVPIPNHDRFETRDPFGNRIELIAKHERDH